jgi:hypothetical protein
MSDFYPGVMHFADKSCVKKWIVAIAEFDWVLFGLALNWNSTGVALDQLCRKDVPADPSISPPRRAKNFDGRA